MKEELGLSTMLVGVNKLIILFLLQGLNEGFRACFLHDAYLTGMPISLYALFLRNMDPFCHRTCDPCSQILHVAFRRLSCLAFRAMHCLFEAPGSDQDSGKCACSVFEYSFYFFLLALVFNA